MCIATYSNSNTIGIHYTVPIRIHYVPNNNILKSQFCITITFTFTLLVYIVQLLCYQLLLHAYLYYGLRGQGGGLGLWAPRPFKFKSTRPRGKWMPVSSFCRSRPRDATRRMSATDSCAAPSQQQQLRRSSNIFTLYNTIAMHIWICTVGRGAADDQLSAMYNILALKWSSHRRVPPRGAAAGNTSRKDAAAPRGGTRAARSISSVAASSAPSQQ